MTCSICAVPNRVGRGLRCPICGLILYGKDDKATGWASRALHAHHENTHPETVRDAMPDGET